MANGLPRRLAVCGPSINGQSIKEASRAPVEGQPERKRRTQIAFHRTIGSNRARSHSVTGRAAEESESARERERERASQNNCTVDLQR